MLTDSTATKGFRPRPQPRRLKAYRTSRIFITSGAPEGHSGLLVDHARRRRAAKRGIPVTLNEEIHPRNPGADQTEEILAVDQILVRLADLEPRQARVVELRYFGGLTVEETAEAMGIAPRTVKLDWAIARGWLQSQLGPRGGL